MSQQQEKAAALSILVVEDDLLLQKLLSGALKQEDHNVFSAATFKDGLKLFEEKRPHIVFIDLELPDDSGHELARQIKEMRPKTHVIIATASEYTEDRDEAEKYKANGYIVKPFDKQKIMVFIDRYLKTHPRQI